MKFTEWMTENWEKDNLLPPSLDAQQAINFLQKYLLGETWHTVNPLSTTQVNVEIVHDILKKYSKTYKKEFKAHTKKIIER